MELFDNFDPHIKNFFLIICIFIIKNRLITPTERRKSCFNLCLFVCLLVCLFVTYIIEKRTQAYSWFHKKPGMTQETIWNIFGCYVLPHGGNGFTPFCMCVCVWRGSNLCLLAKLWKMGVGTQIIIFRIGRAWHKEQTETFGVWCLKPHRYTVSLFLSRLFEGVVSVSNVAAMGWTDFHDLFQDRTDIGKPIIWNIFRITRIQDLSSIFVGEWAPVSNITGTRMN